MAYVFLSYDRTDIAKARSIASALDKAGHSVWWDRHIAGGAQYSREIEQALKRADAVVVLWSANSVDSAWVRDEAGAGRDSGRLVPVCIDGTDAPMGFRQYQTIDFSRRGARHRQQALAEVLHAIEVLGSPGAPTSPQAPSQQLTPRFRIGLASSAALAAVAILAWQMWSPAPGVPSVTVVASENGARTLAADLFVKLGSLQASQTDSLHLVDPASASDVDYSFKVGGVGIDGAPHANLVLVDRAGTLLWSREFKHPGGNEADLRQQIAYSAGQVLNCATDALAPDHRKLDLPVLKLFLNGCAHFSDLTADDARILVPTFRKVTDSAPAFAGGWSKLVLAEMFALRQGDLRDPAARARLRTSIDLARKAHPGIAEPDLAEAWLQNPRPISAWMRFTEAAVAKDPDHAEALMNRATGFLHVGRCLEAVEDSKRAARAEPLYPAARDKLVETLAHCGMQEEARRELEEAERLWPGATNLLQSRHSFEYFYGDPTAAARLLGSGAGAFPKTPVRLSFLNARIDPSPGNISEAIRQARLGWQGASGFPAYVRTLAHFGRSDEAAEVLLATDPRLSPGIIWSLFGPQFRGLRRDPRFMKIAQRLELIPYWQETGKWADFCSEPDLPYDCKAEAAKLSR